METYSDKLRSALGSGLSQEKLATRINRSQAAVSRYAAAIRFPDAETARLIDEATDSAVPFALWQAEAMRRLGIEA